MIDMTETRTYDAIVIGGGHNGVINGAYLAKAGLKTLILERNVDPGGASITEELHPGFKYSVCSYVVSSRLRKSCARFRRATGSRSWTSSDMASSRC